MYELTVASSDPYGLGIQEYLFSESEVNDLQMDFPEIRAVSKEKLLAMSRGTKHVGANQWGKSAGSKHGIYTDEMSSCITVGLTAIGPDGKLISALYHSLILDEMAATIMFKLQSAFGNNGLPKYSDLHSIQYFVVGGHYESIGKTVDILKTLTEMGVNVSGVKLTSTIEERDLVKSLIVTAQGALRYAVEVKKVEAIDFSEPHTGDGGPPGHFDDDEDFYDNGPPVPFTGGFAPASGRKTGEGTSTPFFSSFTSASGNQFDASTPGPFPPSITFASGNQFEASTPPPVTGGFFLASGRPLDARTPSRFPGFASASGRPLDARTPIRYPGFAPASSLELPGHQDQDDEKGKGKEKEEDNSD